MVGPLAHVRFAPRPSSARLLTALLASASFCLLAGLTRSFVACLETARAAAPRLPRNAAVEASAPSEPKRFRASGRAPGGLQMLSDSGNPGVPLEGLLDKVLADVGLAGRSSTVQEWCQEQGAAELGEVAEEVDDLASVLGLSSAKAEMLRAALLRTEKEELELQERRERETRNEMAVLATRFIRGGASQNEVARTWEAVMERSQKS
mmetsp:Transcript_60663/g.141331  ORF Transcript_60663/g.141331 Transcript_60663/m.141331 type:complete len:207 (-) Transcript_60663:61-681(-)